jgi:hypothetical protein
MRLLRLFYILILLVVIGVPIAFGQNQAKLDYVISMLEKKLDWKDVEIGKHLREVVNHPSGEEELANAQVLLIAHLLSVDTGESLAEALDISKRLTQMRTGKWQQALAVFFTASILGLQGEYEKQSEAASFALSSINFKELQKSADPLFKKLQTLFGTNPSDLEDALNMMLANISLKKGNFDDAQIFAKRINALRLRQTISDQIQIQKETVK